MNAVNPHLTATAERGRACRPAGAMSVPACPEGYVALEWLEQAPGFMAYLVGADLVFSRTNDAYNRLVGREDLVGLPFHVALPDLVGQGVLALLQTVMASGERLVERARAVRVVGTAGESQLRYVDVVVQPVPGSDADGRAGVLVLGSDVTMETLSRRNLQFSLTHDVHTGSPERLQVGVALREALAGDGLQVVYQPRVDLVTGAICAVAASVRLAWNGDTVPPATLFEIAEECGLGADLGDWLLRSACAQTARWHAQGFTALRVSVNLSARQFALCGLQEAIESVLMDAGLPPTGLDLGLTEHVLMEDMDRLVDCLQALRRLGIRLCLDDFGTGSSSLANLRRLPIDVLRIDGSFLVGVPEREGAAAVLESIVTMGHSLGMRVVADGVEQEGQCEYLSRHMCDEVQGGFVSGPVPAETMTELLRTGAGLAPHLLRFNRTQPTLLLVDDEPSILSALRRLLRGEGYRILIANSGSEGLQLLAEHPVDVIVSDQRMPEMTGVEFLRTVRQLYPDTVRIVLSGFTELQTVTDAVNAGAIYKFLTKPWDDDQLRSHIQEAVAYRAMANENRLLNLQVRTANQKLAAVNRQLESVLARQQGDIERGEISLDIVHEALDHVPVPVLASDDLGTIVLANRAALALFAVHGQVLGCDVRQLFPDLPEQLREGAACTFEHGLAGRRLAASLHPMGSGSQSRGWLIALTEGVQP